MKNLNFWVSNRPFSPRYEKLVSTMFVLAEKRHEHQKYLSMGKINPRFSRIYAIIHHTQKMPFRHNIHSKILQAYTNCIHWTKNTNLNSGKLNKLNTTEHNAAQERAQLLQSNEILVGFSFLWYLYFILLQLAIEKWGGTSGKSRKFRTNNGLWPLAFSNSNQPGTVPRTYLLVGAR